MSVADKTTHVSRIKKIQKAMIMARFRSKTVRIYKVREERSAEQCSKLISQAASVGSKTRSVGGFIQNIHIRILLNPLVIHKSKDYSQCYPQEGENMITALLLNPCIDRTVFIDGFLYGEMNRIVEVENIPTGKGANVAYAAKKLGEEAGLVMFGTRDNDPVKARLEASGIKCVKLGVFESIRVNTKINNTQDNVVTEINEKGAEVSPEQIEEIIKMSVDAAKKSDFFVLTGSMPKGCDSSLYKEIMTKIKLTARDCKLVLDAEGEAFKASLPKKPYIIKPNKYEIEIHCGRKLESIEQLAKEGMKLHQGGVEYVIISMGGEGAIICSQEGAIYAKTPKVEVLNTVGAGDSMLAAAMIAVKNGENAENIVTQAVSAGSSAVTCTTSELISKSKFQELKSQVKTKKINI